MKRVKLQNFDIKFINHASLFISDEKNKFLTDPWYISPAFGGWVQNPFPIYNDVEEIIKNKNKLNTIISHGHDDHLDDFFIKNYLNNSQIIISKFKSKGFYRRVKNISINEPIEVSQGIENGYNINDIKIYSFINEFAGNVNDSIILIANKDEVVVHANDNYHEQPREVVEQIKLISKDKFLYYFAQAGIANSFPIAFPDYSYHEKMKIINDEIKRFIESFEKNIDSIKPNLAFTYANQSKFNYYNKIVPYENVIEQIDKHSFIKQLYPGDKIYNRTLIRNKTDKINILDELLKRAENECNKFVKSKIETSFKISFLVEKSDQILKPKSNNIFMVADVLTWLNILSGKLNLETIIIGGVGKVIKLHEESMREVARCIGEFSYVYQNKFTKNYFNS